jgi:AmmeMemoRadiSam system protein A
MNPGAERKLRDKEKIFLLKLARKTLENYFKGKEEVIKVPEDCPNLYEKRGVFVTLTKHGNLRGCIGTLEAIYPLVEGVKKMAICAAIEDPRFSPLSSEELSEVEIEISVLSPLKEGKPEDVVVGKHGVYVVKGIYRGVLLPQVPLEYNWDRETFLKHVCLKAGLPPECYKDPSVKFYLFTAEVFSEKDYF